MARGIQSEKAQQECEHQKGRYDENGEDSIGTGKANNGRKGSGMLIDLVEGVVFCDGQRFKSPTNGHEV